MDNLDLPKTADSFATPRLSMTRLLAMLLLAVMFGSLVPIFGLKYSHNLRSWVLPEQSSTTLAQEIQLTESSQVIDVVKSATPAVVSVVVSKDVSQYMGSRTPFAWPWFYSPSAPAAPNFQEVGAGTGFFVSSDGLILTNKHVVSDKDAQYSVITFDQKTYDAKVVASDPLTDIAILKIDIRDAATLSLSQSPLQIGQSVIAIGNSLGQYHNTVTTGVVSGIGRSIRAGGPDGSESLDGVIQTDAAINPGNSGGPLLNIAGQVIGINTAVDLEGQLVGFAIPAEVAKFALDSFKQYGRIVRPYLGVRYVIVNKDLAATEKLPKDYGALIVRGDTSMEFAVQPGSPADKAGMQENDIILEVGGVRVTVEQNLGELLGKYRAGEKVELKVYSDGSEKTLEVTLGESQP